MGYIIVVGGPGSEIEKRLKGAKEIAKEDDIILAVGGFGESLEKILDKNYLHPNEKTVDTIDDALVAKEYIQLDDEVIVVTSNYHIKRTQKIFEKVLNKKVKTYSVDVPYTVKHKFSELIKTVWCYLILMYSPTREKYHEVRRILSPIINKVKNKYL